MSPRLAFALEAAYRAGRATLARFQTGSAYELKEDETPVTAADREAERLIRREIHRAFPSEAVIGEEEGGDPAAAERWIIDPIDGTKSFVCGVPLYATLLAFERERRPVLGVAYFPALDEMVYAEAGAGCFWRGRPCRVSPKTSMRGSVFCTGSSVSLQRHDRWQGVASLAEVAMATRTWGDAYGHALVATGRVEAMLDPIVKRWDVSAMRVIVEEAGGRFTDFSGGDPFAEETEPREAISSNGFVHDEVLAAFRAEVPA